MVQKDPCTPIFIAVLFPDTMEKNWKHPKCLSREEWIKKKWYIWTMEYYSVIKKIMPSAAAWIDLEIIILNEVSQTEREIYHISLTSRS